MEGVLGGCARDRCQFPQISAVELNVEYKYYSYE
jgi:hypothetical protein